MAMHDYNAQHPNIKIQDGGGASTFLLTVREALDRIASQPVGARLLGALNNGPVFGGWNACIKILRPNTVADLDNPGAEGGNRAVAIDETRATGGAGCATAVYFNPTVWVVPGQGSRPPFIGLAHELVHAWHNAYGTKKGSYDEEEQFTVGLGVYAVPNANSITENRIRVEHNLPVRHRY
jgi:hypothetical protein